MTPPPQVSFFAYCMEAPLKSGFWYAMWGPQISFFAYYKGAPPPCQFLRLLYMEPIRGGGGVLDSTERPKLGVHGVKDTAKTNKDLGMSCYIQVKYSVFSIGSSFVTM